MPDEIKRLLGLSMDQILREDIVLSVNRVRGIVTFYDGQFKDGVDDFLYFIMYDPVRHRVILVNRMTIRDAVINTKDLIPGYVITHSDNRDITWVPHSIYQLLGNMEEVDCEIKDDESK